MERNSYTYNDYFGKKSLVGIATFTNFAKMAK